MMRVQIAQSIASADWSYRPTQIVRCGTEFTPDEIPMATATAWLESGVAVPVKEDRAEVVAPRSPETADRKMGKTGKGS